MRTKTKDWKNALDAFTKQINGKLSFETQSVYGTYFELKVATINCGAIKITQSVGKYSYCEVAPEGYLEFNYYSEKIENLSLVIYRRGMISKLLSKNYFTGNKRFDETFKIDSSDKRLALSIFSNSIIQNAFFDDSLIVFNISGNGKDTRVKLKWMEKKIYNQKELFQKFEFYSLVLNQLDKGMGKI